MLSKTHSVDRHYKTLQFAYRRKYFQIVKAKGPENLQDPKATTDLYRNKYSETSIKRASV